MSVLIRIAAGALPAAIRERYREQWLADARDAPEAGLRPNQIGLAALVFAVTYDRPASAELGVATPERLKRRTRLALALAFAGALLSLSTWVEVTLGSTVGAVSNIVVYDYLVVMLTTLLAGFVVLACTVAVVLVYATRRVPTRYRAATWLFVAACFAPVGKSAVDSGRLDGSMLVTPGGLAYVLGLLCVLFAVLLVWRPGRLGGRGALAAAGVVAVATATGFTVATVAWANRVPFFNGAPRNAENQAMWVDWQQLQQSGEDLVNAALIVFAVLGALVALGVLLAGRARPAAAAIFGLAIVAIGLGALFSILRMMESNVVPEQAATLLPLFGRLVIVAVVLYVVGEVRFERRSLARASHRHDVEGGVELVKG